MKRHWFIREEVKWRGFAAAFWTWCVTIPIIAAFTFGIGIDLSRHIFYVSDYMRLLTSLRFFFICIICASLTSSLVFMYTYRLSAVSPQRPVNRMQMVLHVLKPSNCAFLLASTAFFIAVSNLVSSISPVGYPVLLDEDKSISDDSKRWSVAERILPLSQLFGGSVGLFYSLGKVTSQQMCLEFLEVQEAKFLFLKCKFPSVLSCCASTSAGYLYRFLVAYYCIKFAIIIAMSSSHLSFMRILLFFQFGWLFDMMPVLWNLWLTGALSLLLYNISWHICNVFQTQIYSFPLDHPIFSTSDDKLMIQNLNEAQPAIARYLAFLELSLNAKQNFSKRWQIFSLSCGAENRRPVTCDAIMHHCLVCIRNLVADICSYQTSLIDMRNSGTGEHKNKQEDHPAEFISTKSGCSAAGIIGPKARSGLQGGKIRGVEPKQVPNVTANCKTHNLLKYLIAFLPSHSSSTSPQKVPVQTILNIYCKHAIIKWPLRTISYLFAKSVYEDEYGVLQRHLKAVVTDLLQLKKALESVERNIPCSSPVFKLHQSIYFETKTSLYRIASSYGEDLLLINLDVEQKPLIVALNQFEV